MRYLDVLEQLRSQGFPNESVEARRYEILQCFIEGNSSQELRQMLPGNFADERYVTNPPTVEALRFAVLQYFRTCGNEMMIQASCATKRRNASMGQPRLSNCCTQVNQLRHLYIKRSCDFRNHDYRRYQRLMPSLTMVMEAFCNQVLP